MSSHRRPDLERTMMSPIPEHRPDPFPTSRRNRNFKNEYVTQVEESLDKNYLSRHTVDDLKSKFAHAELLL